eukprot:854526-Prymnesium_polylepis.1
MGVRWPFGPPHPADAVRIPPVRHPPADDAAGARVSHGVAKSVAADGGRRRNHSMAAGLRPVHGLEDRPHGRYRNESSRTCSLTHPLCSSHSRPLSARSTTSTPRAVRSRPSNLVKGPSTSHVLKAGGWKVETPQAQARLSFEGLYRWLEAQHARGDNKNLYDPVTKRL